MAPSSAIPRTVGSAMWCKIHSVIEGSQHVAGGVDTHATGVRPRVAFPDRLWSCAGTSGTTCSPSLRHRKLISSPFEKFLDHHLLLRRPQQFSAEDPVPPRRWQTLRVGQMITPLPAASPSAFTTTGGWKCLSSLFHFLAL